MSTWTDILLAAADGNQSIVEEYLRVRLPAELRQPTQYREESMLLYTGPVVKAVLHSFRSLNSQAEQEFAESWVNDVVDYITDQIVDKVRRTADLVTFCRLNPALTIDQVAMNFTGWNNLKRSKSDRAEWTRLNLWSMAQIGIPLPADSAAVKEASGSAAATPLGFEERALIKGWDVRRSWDAFMRQQEINEQFLCIQENDTEGGVFAEAVDFGVISESKLAVHDPLPVDQSLELEELAIRVAEMLDGILDDLTRRKPQAGFNAIAWHSAWWHFTDKYSGMPLKLRLEEPCCDTDQVLADHIQQYYAEFPGVNRMCIQRRRTQLTEQCEGALITVVRTYLNR